MPGTAITVISSSICMCAVDLVFGLLSRDLSTVLGLQSADWLDDCERLIGTVISSGSSHSLFNELQQPLHRTGVKKYDCQLY